MSHFTRIKTKMVEEEYLTQALTDLGYEWEAGKVAIRGFGGERRKVDIRVKTGFLKRDIGFIKSADGYAVVADWWGTGSGQRDKFIQQVTQKYAYHAAKAKLAVQGFTLVSEEQQEDGHIHLVLRRMTS